MKDYRHNVEFTRVEAIAEIAASFTVEITDLITKPTVTFNQKSRIKKRFARVNRS